MPIILGFFTEKPNKRPQIVVVQSKWPLVKLILNLSKLIFPKWWGGPFDICPKVVYFY